MKTTRIPGDDRHIIIGVSNVDTQVKDRMAAERAVEEKKTYMRLSALSGNLIVLYYVDPVTESYTEFSAAQEYEDYGLAKQGTDFFQSVSAEKTAVFAIWPLMTRVSTSVQPRYCSIS